MNWYIIDDFRLTTLPGGEQGVLLLQGPMERAEAMQNEHGTPVSGIRETDLVQHDGRTYLRCLDKHNNIVR